MELSEAEQGSSATSDHPPFGQFPVLVTPQGNVPRTSAIIRYVSGLRMDRGLLGVTQFDEAAVDQWLEWSAASLDAPVALLATPTAAYPASISPAAVKDAQQSVFDRLPPRLAVLEAHLAHRTFIVGERPTAADITIYAAVHALVSCGKFPAVAADVTRSPATPSIESFPHLARWYYTCRALPYFESAAGAATASSSASAATGAAGGSSVSASSPSASGSMLPTALTATTTVLPNARFSRVRQRIGDLLATGASLIGGPDVVVCGWARTVREAAAGAILFIALNDGSCFESLQVVTERGVTVGFEAAANAGELIGGERVRGEITIPIHHSTS